MFEAFAFRASSGWLNRLLSPQSLSEQTAKQEMWALPCQEVRGFESKSNNTELRADSKAKPCSRAAPAMIRNARYCIWISTAMSVLATYIDFFSIYSFRCFRALFSIFTVVCDTSLGACLSSERASASGCLAAYTTVLPHNM